MTNTNDPTGGDHASGDDATPATPRQHPNADILRANQAPRFTRENAAEMGRRGAEARKKRDAEVKRMRRQLASARGTSKADSTTSGTSISRANDQAWRALSVVLRRLGSGQGGDVPAATLTALIDLCIRLQAAARQEALELARSAPATSSTDELVDLIQRLRARREAQGSTIASTEEEDQSDDEF